MECREYGSTNLSPDPLSSAHEKALVRHPQSRQRGTPFANARRRRQSALLPRILEAVAAPTRTVVEGERCSRAVTAPAATAPTAATAHTAPTAPTAVVATLACIGATEATADAIGPTFT